MPSYAFDTELQVNGAWTDISDDVRENPPISCARGRRDESSQVTHGRCNLTLDNTDGRYSPRNPLSTYYGQIGRNTPLRVSLDTPTQDVADTFSRTVSNTWTSADSGQAYSYVTAGGGSINDFDVTGGEGTIVVSGANQYRVAHLPGVAAVDGDALLGPINLPAIAGPTGGTVEPAGVAFRMRSGTNYYLARAEWTTANGIVIKLFTPDNVTLTNTTVFTSAQWTVAEDLMMRVRWEGEAIRVRMWQADQSEPATWNVEVYDTTYLGPGGVGVRAGIASGNTNGSLTFGYGAFTVDTRAILFTGEVSEWPQRWNVPGTDVTVPVEAAGPMRRLAQGAKALRSPLHRAILATSPLAYWTLEDLADATFGASALNGGTPMTITGSLSPSSSEGTAGSAPIFDLSPSGQLSAPIPAGGSATSWRAEVVVKFETDLAGGEPDFLGIRTADGRAWILYGIGAAGFGLFLTYASGFTSSDTIFDSTFSSGESVVTDKQAHHVRLDVEQNGGNIDVTVTIDGTVAISDSYAGTLAAPASLLVNALPDSGDFLPTVGHYAVWAPYAPNLLDPPDTAQAAAGWVGEAAAERITRLCAEEGIPLALNASAGTGALLGAQRMDTLLNLLQDAASADRGVLGEMRGDLGLRYRTLDNLYNQTPVELDYTAGQVAPTLAPTDDDQHVHNDVTTARTGGSSARYAVTTGPLSTQPPPDGVGTYDRGRVEVNVATDGQLADVAGWIAHLGTWDEARYPTATVDLGSAALLVDLDLALTLLALDTGDLLSIVNPPAWLPPEDIVMMAQGVQTTLHQYAPAVAWNTTPGRPYTVAEADGDPRADTDGTFLNAAKDTTATSWTVRIDDGNFWTTAAADLPFDIMVGGERMTVTAVGSPSGNLQVFTVTRSVNGVVKSHAAEAPIHVAEPAYAAL